MRFLKTAVTHTPVRRETAAVFFKYFSVGRLRQWKTYQVEIISFSQKCPSGAATVEEISVILSWQLLLKNILKLHEFTFSQVQRCETQRISSISETSHSCANRTFFFRRCVIESCMYCKSKTVFDMFLIMLKFAKY